MCLCGFKRGTADPPNLLWCNAIPMQITSVSDSISSLLFEAVGTLYSWFIVFANTSQRASLDTDLVAHAYVVSHAFIHRLSFPQGHVVNFLCNFLVCSIGSLLRIKQGYYMSKPLELQAAKDRFFLSVWEVKKWLINSGRHWNFKWRYKWHCANGLQGDEGIWYNNPLPKIFKCIFHSSTLSPVSREKRAGFHQKWRRLERSLSNEEQGSFFPPSCVCSVWLAGTCWLINTGREREREKERVRDQHLSISHALDVVPANAGSLHFHTVRGRSYHESRWRPRS